MFIIRRVAGTVREEADHADRQARTWLTSAAATWSKEKVCDESDKVPAPAFATRELDLSPVLAGRTRAYTRIESSMLAPGAVSAASDAM